MSDVMPGSRPDQISANALAPVTGARRWVAFAGLALLALGVGPSSAAIGISYVLLLLFALTTWREIGALWVAGWAPRILILLTLYVIVQGLLVGLFQSEPDFSGGDLQHMVRTVCLGTLLAGWAIYASRFPLRLLAALFAAGLALVTLEAFMEHGTSLFSIRRMHYLRSPNEVGLFGGTTFLIGLFLAGGSALRRANSGAQRATAIAMGGVALLLIFSGLWLWLQSGSRSTWIGLMTALLLVGMIAGFKVVRERRGIAHFAASALVAVVVVAGLGAYYADDIRPRIEREIPSVQAIAAGDTEALMSGRAAGHNARFKIWASALGEIRERPLVGWGSGSLTSHFELAADAGTVRSGRDHYHNLYLHLAVFLGAPAVLLAILTYARLFHVAATQLVAGTSRNADLGWFLTAWGVFFAVTSLFQVRMHSAYGAAFFIVFTGLALALYLQAKASKTAGEGVDS